MGRFLIHAIDICARENLVRGCNGQSIAITVCGIVNQSSRLWVLISSGLWWFKSADGNWTCLGEATTWSSTGRLDTMMVKRGMKRQIRWPCEEGGVDPLVGPEPFCGLGGAFFEEEIKRFIIATTRDILYRVTQNDRRTKAKAKDLLGGCNFKRFRARKTRLKRFKQAFLRGFSCWGSIREILIW